MERSGTTASRVRPAALALAFVAALLILGTAAPEVHAAAPSIAILSPADGALIGNGTPVTVIFVVSNFNLTPPASAVGPTPGEGYVNVYVNGELRSVADQETIVLPLPSGVYGILLRLVLSNGTFLGPESVASVNVTVTQGPAVGTPKIQATFVEITYPISGVVLNDDVTISFRVTDFALVPPGKAPPVPHEGHVAVYVDGNYYQAVYAYDPVFFSDFKDGSHTVRFQLVDNAGHPLTPDASSSVTFRIQGSPVVDITPWLLDAQVILGVAIVFVLFYRGWGLTWLRGLRTRFGRRNA